MEENINIAKILKDKPVNTKLWSPLFGDVYTSSICSEDTIIVVNHHAKSSSFYNNGKYFDHAEAEPLLFPSKEMRDWSKFLWKKGDVLQNNDHNIQVIFDGFTSDTYEMIRCKYWLKVDNGNEKFVIETNEFTKNFFKISEELSQCYIYEIENRLGGKLNLETLEIEKQLEFKDGDIVVYGKSVAICRRIYKNTLSFYVSLNEMVGLLFADEVESSEEYRFATDEDKQKLFDALAKKGKAWDSEKKQIVDLPKKCEFKPFDKVLVRNTDTEEWFPGFFEKFDSTWNNPYHIMNRRSMTDFAFKQCIPYEGNEHLLGTTKDVEG